ncbi:conserved protein of unknown function [Nitrosotalea devaniterrae]|uniref:Uncharacterized protein n=1 Tax=Nitrosotalea devaniterrae TaxID=1078905 RepID=A0A128A436_9ARCH|nr:conserved protein of unknown function [Candidatus Nitrosotalea devanaterra]
MYGHYVLVSSAKPQEKTVDTTHHLSVCDVMRDNTNEVIMKIEGLLPSYIESFADLQAEGLRITRDFFGTCYIAEKELLDKMGVDQKAIESFGKYFKAMTMTTVSEIDMINNFQKAWVENVMSSMKSYDDYVKVMLSSYAKMLEYTSAMIPKKT